MTFKCKICGGQTTIDSQNGVAICEYCGTKQALPLFTEDSERLLYESGNNYLSHSEYDKAENVFNQLLTIKPNAAELYWDLVLCKFGVTYVKDPKTGKYIPTCNRTHYTPIFSDKNYLKAIELSSGEKKSLFEEDAKTIDNIQKGIIAVSKKEKPFDIFISYKETDANGNRTKDSVEAQRLYEKLTEAGYKVFFSRITLEDKIGTEYEPYIYAALYSSKVMLTISSSNENLEAVWVKNEWSRFLGFRQHDSSKTLLPLYFDMEKSDLPDEFALLSSYDMKADGFEDELLRGIKKLIPLPIMKAKRRKQFMKTVGIAAASLVVVIGIVAAIIIPKKLEEKRIQEEAIANESSYQSAIALFENADYIGAADVFTALGDYKDSVYMVERCAIQPDYDAAMQLYYDGNYAESAWAFAALGDYEDAAEQKVNAEDSWRKSLATVYDSGYYITENGTVKLVKNVSGNAHYNIDVSENGKVVSIKNNGYYTGHSENLVVLYENGLVTQSDFDEQIANNSQWNSIIKVSDTFYDNIIGLRSDGKLIVLNDTLNSREDVISGITECSDIIDFKHNYSRGNGGTGGLLVALKVDGTLCAVDISDKLAKDSYDMELIEGILRKYTDVKSFAINGNGQSYFTLTAVTKENKLLVYADGEFKESDGKDICAVITTDIALKSNGDLVELNSGKVLLRDVVHAQKENSAYYAITRSGSVYAIETYPEFAVKQTENQTLVYEEWISRLD